MIVAVIPILRRSLLVPYTLRRLNKIVDKVICVVENQEDRFICTKGGAFTVSCPGVPLGEKWNVGFLEAKQFDPDFVLYMGSSDWVSDNYLDVMLPIAQDYEITGVLDFHLLHLEYKDDNKLISRNVKHWKGYENHRRGEPIGGGRLVRRDYLDRVKWSPFDPELLMNLDYSMITKTKNFKGIMSDEAQSMAVSTSLWSNKHEFNGEEVKDGDKYLTKWFPEGLKLF